MPQIRVGIVGCGNISGIYFQNLTGFKHTTVTACADIALDRAAAAANKYDIPWSGSPEDLLKREDVDLVVNLTVPGAHYSVAEAALQAGKLAYNEKPFCVERAEGARLLELANEKGLAVGGAPDTFLGSGIQTCRKLIDSGAIGQPIGFNAFMHSHGPDGWHPNPEFFYKRGGGPLLDMGPYYVTALVFLLGPVERAIGLAKAPFATRTLTVGDRAGTSIPIETPTHIVGALEFAQGAIGQVNVSFESWGAKLPWIEVYGTEGTLSVPDPNTYGGPIWLAEAKQSRQGKRAYWREMPLEFRFASNSRGLGPLDLGMAHREGRPARAGGELAFHVLDIMHSILESAETGVSVSPRTRPPRPEPMAQDGPEDDL